MDRYTALTRVPLRFVIKLAKAWSSLHRFKYAERPKKMDLAFWGHFNLSRKEYNIYRTGNLYGIVKSVLHG